MTVVSSSVQRGVPPGPTPGREKLRFVALAEEEEDLDFICTEEGGQHYLHTEPAIDTTARLLDALADAGEVDIAIAPELTLAEAGETALLEGMAKLGRDGPRIVLAGSGVTAATGASTFPFNEARAVSRGGKTLWRQRKVWPFGLGSERAKQYGLVDPGTGNLLMEKVEGGDTLKIVDIETLGRVAILICQDLQTRPLADELVRTYRPDWILAPILDPGVTAPGWAHLRAFNLGSGQSRFLISSSLSLSRRRGDEGEVYIGLAVGPTNPTANLAGQVDPSRSTCLVAPDLSERPLSATIDWEPERDGWDRTNVQLDPV